MAISFQKKDQIFRITTKNTLYAFGIVNGIYLAHLYYGKKLPSPKLEYRPCVVSFAPYSGKFGNSCSTDIFPQEMPTFGCGDFRAPAIRIRNATGDSATRFVYRSHKVFSGRKDLSPLPQARADENTNTLLVTLEDPDQALTLRLYYTVFYECDVITRSIELENQTDSPVVLEKCMPLSLDLPGYAYDMISLYGGHVDERNLERAPLRHGSQSVFSRRGASSHQFNPFIALCEKKTNEEKGSAYGFNFVYSGSFLDEVEVDQMDNTRVQIGLGSENFSYRLESGERFLSPEAMMTYSAKGLGGMARNFHAFTNRHIVPEGGLAATRPVVLNTWEACYFNIDEEKLVRFAEESAKTGMDMLVMDDGWFGKRNGDKAGLGDWTPNPEKFKNGLGSFVSRVKEKGIQFGIWIEPEMVNPDSDLYRAHPQWCLQAGKRELSLSRDQLVLDMSNPAVVDYLIESYENTFRGVSIDYFKWDMNRHLSEVGSTYLSKERQGETWYRYMLGVYRLLSWLRTRFPDAILETCSGGGGRYDLGMMAFGHQIWTSDNTNPYARIRIQYASMLAYPASQMSCHVSNPGTNLRSLDFRYKVAVGGMLGYELNILNATDDVKRIMSKQIKEYKTFDHLMRLGDYFPLISPFEKPYSAYYYASEDRSEILLSFLQRRGAYSRCKGKDLAPVLRVKEALADARYEDRLTGEVYDGQALRAGITLAVSEEDDTARIFHFVKL